MDATIAALLREREGYIIRELPDRVAAVNAQLAALGYETARAEPPPPPTLPTPESAALVASETATINRPRPRRRHPNE